MNASRKLPELFGPEPLALGDLIRERIECHRIVIAWAIKVQGAVQRLKVQSNDLQELIAFASIHDDMEQTISRSQREMQRLSRSRVFKEYDQGGAL